MRSTSDSWPFNESIFWSRADRYVENLQPFAFEDVPRCVFACQRIEKVEIVIIVARFVRLRQYLVNIESSVVWVVGDSIVSGSYCII